MREVSSRADLHHEIRAEGRVLGVLFRIAREQAELAGKVLDVVHDKGHAPVELVEAAGFKQRGLSGMFSQSTSSA